MKRYYVLEHTGYPIKVYPRGTQGGSTRPAKCVEAMVIDRNACHEVVWSSWWNQTSEQKAITGHPKIAAARRSEAHALCDRLNAQQEQA